jgi:hypothetical protein
MLTEYVTARQGCSTMSRSHRPKACYPLHLHSQSRRAMLMTWGIRCKKGPVRLAAVTRAQCSTQACSECRIRTKSQYLRFEL